MSWARSSGAEPMDRCVLLVRDLKQGVLGRSSSGWGLLVSSLVVCPFCVVLQLGALSAAYSRTLSWASSNVLHQVRHALRVKAS